jgi:RNA polymerase sigma factor (sigma-70 family)
MYGHVDDGEHDGVFGERHHLVSVAFRMLGTVADAEDAVQETYIRWFRMSEAEREAIIVPRAWLTRATSRICLNVLSSARHRREMYVGEWLPEPVPAFSLAPVAIGSEDPLDRVSLDESISTALLVVLESMTPAERVAFVLHDVFAMPFNEIAQIVGRTPAACRQLALSARGRIEKSRKHRATHDEHERVVKAFAAAARAGDIAGLIAVLDPQVVLRSDGGGVVSAALNPITGRDRVARFILGVLAKHPEATVVNQDTTDGAGFVLMEDGRTFGVVTLDVIDGVVSDVRLMMNPYKLSLWK